MELKADDRVDPLGRRRVEFVVADAQGRPIPNALLSIEYFQDAHASEVRKATLSADGADPKRFSAVLPMRYAGIWEYQVTVTAGDKTYVEKKTQTLTNAPASMLEDAMP